MARYALTAIINTTDRDLDAYDAEQPTPEQVVREFHGALVHWQEDVGDVYFEIETYDYEYLGA